MNKHCKKELHLNNKEQVNYLIHCTVFRIIKNISNLGMMGIVYDFKIVKNILVP